MQERIWVLAQQIKVKRRLKMISSQFSWSCHKLINIHLMFCSMVEVNKQVSLLFIFLMLWLVWSDAAGKGIWLPCMHFPSSKGKPAKSLPDLLREHNLPAGLFPRNITCYEYEESRSELIVYLASACEVSFKDSSIIRYTTRVKGNIDKGKTEWNRRNEDKGSGVG